MKAIVYTSNAGSTADYAGLLAHETGLPFYSAKEAKKKLPAGAEILYLGWIMADSIQGYAEAAKRYKICAVCGVGMGKTGTRLEKIQEKNAIPTGMPLFTLQGNFDLEKLHGVYKIMMRLMAKTAGKSLAEKAERTPEEDDLLDMLLHGGDHVCAENLAAVLDWYRAHIQNA